jgi:hypothetical protein
MRSFIVGSEVKLAVNCEIHVTAGATLWLDLQLEAMNACRAMICVGNTVECLK